MSVFLALAIIVAIIAVIAVAIRRNNNVKAAAVVATTEVVAATTATETHAGEQPVVEVINQDCMEAVVMVLAYTKSALKEERLNGRRARARAWHTRSCAIKEAARVSGAEKRKEITLACTNRAAVRAAKAKQEALERAAKRAQESLERASNGNTLSAATKAARAAQGSAQRAANAARKQAAAHVGKKATANRHVAPQCGIVSITANGHKAVVVTPANKQAVKSVRTYVRQAANKPAIISGTQLAEQARTAGTNLATQIRVAKTTLASLYEILPLARQVVALQSKADRKVGMYTWLADEGHVGVRSTKSSIARRDAAQEVVCQAALAAEAFKDAYGIEASEVVSQILVVKAAKARAIAMLRNHKAEQHRLFIERQERRAAKAALKASKAAPATAPAVTEVADWEKYAPVNSGNKSIAFGILHAKGSTMAEKISAAIAIVGASHEDGLVSCQTADAAYVVAA